MIGDSGAGNADHILVSDQDAFSFGDGTGNDKPFTFSVWVFIEDASGGDDGPFITKGQVGGGTNIEYIFKQESGVLRLFLYKGDNTGTTNRLNITANAASISDATWTHVAATYDGSKNHAGLKLYTNGAQTAATTVENGVYSTAGGTRNTSQPLIIGKTNNDPATTTQAFEDFMADVCIFNKELTAAEIAEIYNGGKVKNMLKASTYSNLISWWKMGDDQDTDQTGGIKDYVSGYNGSVQNGAIIETVPALPTDRIYNNSVMIPSSWGRTRQPKNVAGDHQVYVHGGIAGNMPTADPSGAPAGYATENQRYLHLYWKAASTTAAITAWGYSYASGQWSELYDTNGTQVKLSVSAAAANIVRVFEVSGVDRVYFKQSGTALAATDLFAAAASSF